VGGTWETIAIPCGVGGRREGCRKPSWIPTTPTTSEWKVEVSESTAMPKPATLAVPLASSSIVELSRCECKQVRHMLMLSHASCQHTPNCLKQN
jgi:hypothetical protein